MKKGNRSHDQQMLDWGRKALKGMGPASHFFGVMDDRPLNTARIEFTLQIGHALLTGKPIILVVPLGMELPPKLEAAATRVVRCDIHNEQSLQGALREALAREGIIPQ